MSEAETKSPDLFELSVAILLGLGALGGSFAAFQESKWGGNASEAYVESHKIATQASTEKNSANTLIASDRMVDIQAKKAIAEGYWYGEVSKNPTLKEVNY